MVAPAPAIPTYNFKDGETWTFKVKGKAEIQPYGVAGPLTVKFSKGPKGWMMTLNHKTEMEMNGETGPGQEMTGVFGVDSQLIPDGSGEGALMFGDQLLAALAMPTKEEVKLPLLGDAVTFTTKAVEEKEFIKVTSQCKGLVGQHVVERWIDAKTSRLVKAKVVSTMAIGKINYELLPVK